MPMLKPTLQLQDIPETPVSTTLMEHVEKVVSQWREGAIHAPEGLFSIINRYVEQQETVGVEAAAMEKWAADNPPSWLRD